jgi:transposase InsO family protein
MARPAGVAGQKQAHPPAVARGEPASPAAPQEEESDRYRRRRRREVTDPSESDMAMDFQFDTTADGRTIKLLNVIDEFTREALAIEVDRGIDADGVVDVLDRLVLHHGAPHYVRFDNGSEFVAHAVHDWCLFNSAGSLFIDPGSPWQNAWIESFNGRLRDEVLNSWRFDSLLRKPA